MKKYSVETLNYIKYNTGLLSNKFICKKLNITIKQLYKIQIKLGIGARKSLIGFDLMPSVQAKKELGLCENSNKLKKSVELGLIKLTKIGKGSKSPNCITLEDFEKIEKFFQEWINLNQTKKILKIDAKTIKKYLAKNPDKIRIKKIKTKTFYNKEDTLNLKKFFSEQKENFYTVNEFAKEINHDISLIYKKIKKGEIITKGNSSPMLIPISEIKKFKN